ncbi:FkbM family methyltransferase [Paenibacillus sp. GCM10027628]|uniref:FkbM family methyltransferase n=1 Tax=Paenibacillus sp. GCM10027628 TaxID=3273413 RepID=UPI003631F5BC
MDTVRVAFAIDNGYVDVLCVALHSLLKKTNKNRKYEIFILEHKVNKDNKQKITNLINNYVNCSVIFSNFDETTSQYIKALSGASEHYSVATFFRLELVTRFPEIDKIVYLDSDVIILEDISNLYDLDIGDNYSGASIDYSMLGNYYSQNKLPVLDNQTVSNYYNQIGFNKHDSYFQAGIMVFNLKKMREDNISEKIFELCKNVYYFQDQDVLNIAFQGKNFDIGYNWNYESREWREKEWVLSFLPDEIKKKFNNSLIIQKPSIIHFSWKRKPWVDPSSEFASVWWKNAKEINFQRLPLISVIVPIYNVEPYLNDCLNSIVKQSYPNLEVILVEDCSTDNSQHIANEFVLKYDYFQMIKHTTNSGLSQARNSGLDIATGKYVMFIDSDDMVKEHFISQLCIVMENTNYDFAMCDVQYIDSKNHWLYTDNHIIFREDLNKSLTPKIDLDSLHYYDISIEDLSIVTYLWPSAWNKIYRREIIENNNLRFPVGLYYEDHEFYYSYFFKCKNIAYIPMKNYEYRSNRTGQITNTINNKIFDVFPVLDNIKKLLYANMNNDDAKYAYLKVLCLLLLERSWIIPEDNDFYRPFLKKASYYLKEYTLEEAKKYKFHYVSESDLEKIFRKVNLKQLMKKTLKKVLKKLFQPLYWRLELRLTQIFERELNKIIYPELERVYNKIDSRIGEHVYWGVTEVAKNAEEIIDEYIFLSTTETKNNISNIAQKLENATNKIDQRVGEHVYWGVTEVRKDLNEKINTVNSSYTEFKPFWEPVNFEAFTPGHSWVWADVFKEYERANNNIDEQKQKLFRNLSVEDIKILEGVWDRYINVLPKVSEIQKGYYLFNTNKIFNEKELSEQKRIIEEFNEVIEGYTLPEGAHYEIPVFYYHNGLKHLPDIYKKYIQNGVFVDIGGYVGDSAVVMCEYSPNKVISFDILKENIENINYTAKINNRSSLIVAEQFAISDISDQYVNVSGEKTIATVYNTENHRNIYKEQDSIKTKKLDDYVIENNISNVKVIKIDAEGFDFEAIKGAIETIKRDKPVILASLYHTPKDFFNIKPFIEELGLNYEFYIQNQNPFDPVYEIVLVCLPKIDDGKYKDLIERIYFENSKSKKTVYLHVGSQKTATSSIQSTLSNNIHILRKYGYFYPENWPDGHSWILASMFWDNPVEFGGNIVANRTKEDCIKYNEQNKQLLINELLTTSTNNIIFSGEDISLLSYEGVEKLKVFLHEVLPEANIKIVICFRELISYMTSSIQESIKSGLFLEEAKENILKYETNYYQNRIEKFIDIFGKENIIAYKFEDAVAYEDGPVAFFLKQIGISNFVIDKLQIIKTNEGVSRQTVDIINFINTVIPLVHDNKLSNGRIQLDTINLYKIAGERFYLDTDTQKQFLQNNKDDILWLKHKLLIDYTDAVHTQFKKTAILFDDQYAADIKEVLPTLTPVLIKLCFDYFKLRLIEAEDVLSIKTLNSLINWLEKEYIDIVSSDFDKLVKAVEDLKQFEKK